MICIYEDRAEDIGKAISFLHTNYINGCAEFKHLITDPNAKKNISLKKEKNSLITKMKSLFDFDG